MQKYDKIANYWERKTDNSEFIAKTKVKCKCGHTMNFFSGIQYLECTYCHRMIFRSKKAEFDYRTKRKLGLKR